MRRDNWSQTRPVAVAFILLLIALALRIIDMFVLRTDQRIGEQVFNKVGGLALIIAYVWWARGTLGSIGFHARRWLPAVALALAAMIIAQVVGHAAGGLYLRGVGESGSPFIGAESHPAIPRETGTGGALLVAILLLGNVINASMEEGLFRGVFITHLGSRMPLGRANLVQALLFGAWHICVPARAYLDGEMDLVTAVMMSVFYVLISGLVAFTWGHYYRVTNSLWAPWTAHFVNNTVLNFLHLSGTADQPLAMGVITLVIAVVSAALLPLFVRICSRLKMPTVQVWTQSERRPAR